MTDFSTNEVPTMRRILTMAATLAAVTLPAAHDIPTGAEPTPAQERPTRERPTQRSTAQDRDAVAITVYNQSFGLVRETRTLDLRRGRILLEYGDVASGIQPETVDRFALDERGEPVRLPHDPPVVLALLVRVGGPTLQEHLAESEVVPARAKALATVRSRLELQEE